MAIYPISSMRGCIEIDLPKIRRPAKGRIVVVGKIIFQCSN